MKKFLTAEQSLEFKQLYKTLKSTEGRNKIKAISYLNKGLSFDDTSELLLIDDETVVRRWFEIFQSEGMQALLNDKYTGKPTKINAKRILLHWKRVYSIKKIPYWIFENKSLSMKIFNNNTK